MEDLINRTLRLGDSVRVGRKSFNEVAINRPYLSGVHCELDVTSVPASSTCDKLSCGVCDRSSNGTWLVRTSGEDIQQSSLDKTEFIKSNAVRLRKGVREELTCGDCVLLLAPFHPDCRQFRFVLERGSNDQELAFRQLPYSLGADASPSPNKHMATSDHNMAKTTPTIGVKRGSDASDSPPAKTTPTIGVKRGSDASDSPPAKTTPTIGVKRGSDASDSPPATRKILRLERKNVDVNCMNFELEGGPNRKESTDVLGNKATVDGRHGDCDHSSASPEVIPSLRHEPSVELCPLCHDWFPVLELISHVDSCTFIGGNKDEDVVEMDGAVSFRSCDPVRKYTLETNEGTQRETDCVDNDFAPETNCWVEHNTIDVVKVTVAVPPSDTVQCPLCFERFALSAVETHSLHCSSKDIDTVQSMCISLDWFTITIVIIYIWSPTY